MLKLAKPVVKLTFFTASIIIIFLLILFAYVGWGYYSLTYEERIAVIQIKPNNNQKFKAMVNWSHGSYNEYDINGDQFYIDAKILKWKNWFSTLGVHPWYKFERLGGRYLTVEDELNKPRKLYNLSDKKFLDIFELRLKNSWLGSFVDAEYGSATFVIANTNKVYELTVGRTGLIMREL